MRVPSRSSRSPSPSHQITKFAELGLEPMFDPEAFSRPDTFEDQNSPPGLPAVTLAPTPRPLSPSGLVCNRTEPYEPTRLEDGELPLSCTMNTSWPGRFGTKSETWSASPWPKPVRHSASPSEPTAMAP